MLVRKKAGGEHGLALLDGLLDIHGTQQAVLHDVQWDLQARHKSQLAVLSQTTHAALAQIDRLGKGESPLSSR